MKPIIGVMPLYDEQKESYWMLPNYMEAIEQAGGIPIMLPLSQDPKDISQIFNSLDGLLFTGGQDISTHLYGEVAKKYCGKSFVQRDMLEKIYFEKAYNLDKPCLGICRGIQLFNALLGGTLYQDVNIQRPTQTIHHQKPPYDKPVHKVIINTNSLLYDILCKKELFVNSYHHQAIKKLSPKLYEMAISEDGFVEAVSVPNKKYIIAVQWHPEYSFKVDINSRKIFNSFIEACG